MMDGESMDMSEKAPESRKAKTALRFSIAGIILGLAGLGVYLAVKAEMINVWLPPKPVKPFQCAYTMPALIFGAVLLMAGVPIIIRIER